MADHAVVIAGAGPTGLTAMVIRPDEYVAWVGDGTDQGLGHPLNTWFKPPTAGSCSEQEGGS